MIENISKHKVLAYALKASTYEGEKATVVRSFTTDYIPKTEDHVILDLCVGRDTVTLKREETEELIAMLQVVLASYKRDGD